MSEHTPGPWSMDDSKESVVARDGIVAGCCNADRTRSECRANAAHIVRACNSHDQLVAACERAVNTFRYAAGTFRSRGHDTAAEAMILAEISTQAAITRAAGRLE